MSHSSLGNIALQEKTRREVLHKSDLIPPLPDFVVRLINVLNKPDTEPQHLERHLQSDQVLVAKMLAMVNSPFYGLNRTVRTIKEAVMVLGFRGVRSLVLATSTAKFLQRDYSCYGHDDKGLWTHAAAVAAGGRHLARVCKLGPDAAEQMFVAGLMHDIGKLLLVPYLNAAMAQQAISAESTCALEVKVAGIDHTEAGALVVAKWNLTTELQEVIKAHHCTTHMGSAKAIATIRLADAMAHERGIGYLPGRAPRPQAQRQDLQVLEISPANWDNLRNELAVTMDEAVAALSTL